MDIDQHFIFISSNQSNNIFSLNTNSNFTIELPSLLNLNDYWEVALKEIWYKSTEAKEIVDILTDFCNESLVNGNFLPILRRIYIKKGLQYKCFDDSFYLPISRKQLKNISFYLKSSDNNYVSFLSGELNITLHLRRRRIGFF